MMRLDDQTVVTGAGEFHMKSIIIRAFIGLLALSFIANSPTSAAERPNVVLVMTDDQGIGDFGATGNPVFETPRIDAMAGRSSSMTTFYVSPVCSPTRACLMTGRYNYRTRVIDTWLGRSMMEPNEVTIAEALSEAGYATGIFGKWHLGDCYPMRAIDQGFDEALIHRGGGLAQPSEPRENRRRYTDAILFHNGQQVQSEGFCTDVYFDAALDFIDQANDDGKNFFVYIPTNAPHSPYHDVPEDLRQHYMEKADQLAELIVDTPNNLQREIDTLARIAAMITNVDQNMGKLFDRLDAMDLTENTLVIFLVDNGPNTSRYVGNLRGKKNNVHDGGVRSPLWLQWPARLAAGQSHAELAAHIDLMPTILEACGVEAPGGVDFDGRSLMPILTGQSVDWSDRQVVLQTHRGDQPVRYHHFMIRDPRWKLLHASGFGTEDFSGAPKFELYDLLNDPGESKNLVDEQPEVFARLKASYDAWFDDVSSTRPDNYAPPRIQIGTPHEDVTVLTRQDWRDGTWEAEATGFWELSVPSGGEFEVRIEFDERPTPGFVVLRVGNADYRQAIPGRAESAVFEGIDIPAGDTRLQAVLTNDGKQRGIYQAFVSRR